MESVFLESIVIVFLFCLFAFVLYVVFKGSPEYERRRAEPCRRTHAATAQEAAAHMWYTGLGLD